MGYLDQQQQQQQQVVLSLSGSMQREHVTVVSIGSLAGGL